MTTDLRRSRLRGFAVAAALAFAACAEDPPAAPPADDRLLVVDGITITLADTAPYVAFLDSFLPEGGRKAKVRRALEEYLLPLRLAQRAFATERAEQLRQARLLCEVATNAVELDQRSKLLPERHRGHLRRTAPKLPVAMFLFDPLRIGSVSEPLEVPMGFTVAASFDYLESALLIDDRVDALQVGFFTHDAGGWATWLVAEQQRIADTVTHVHPDYREAMPGWLHLPRQQ